MYHIIYQSCHIIYQIYHINHMSYISYHIYYISYHITYHIIYQSYHITIYHISYHIIPYHITSYHIISILSYHNISYIISYHTITYHTISHHISIISHHIIIIYKHHPQYSDLATSWMTQGVGFLLAGTRGFSLLRSICPYFGSYGISLLNEYRIPSPRDKSRSLKLRVSFIFWGNYKCVDQDFNCPRISDVCIVYP